MAPPSNNPSPATDTSFREHNFIEMFKLHDIIVQVPDLEEEPSLSERSIYKVPCNLREVNKEAYTPLMISIGPMHFGKEKFMPMQEHKIRYFNNFLKRVSLERMNEYKEYLEFNEKWIRQRYAEKFTETNREKFVRIMLLDAVFIMELLLRDSERKLQSNKHEQQYQQVTESSSQERDNDDFILTQSWLSRNIARDLILLENQIPFEVLDYLYKNFVVQGDNEKKTDTRFVDLANDYFKFYYMSSSDEPKKQYSCCGSSSTSKETCNSTRKVGLMSESPKHFTELIRSFYLPTKDRNNTDDHVPHVLRTATKLRDSGVSFEKSDADDNKPLLEITFDKKPFLSSFLCLGCFPCMKFLKARLRIPQLKVNHTTECVFRNLIAFEQCHYPKEPYICNYVSLIDSLIHTKKDVDMLVEKEVIVHELGSDEEVATLVNSLCKHVVTDSTCYHETINSLNDHYMKQWFHTVAALRFVYFRDLWRASSTLVGIAVLIFTVFQFLRVLPIVLNRM